MKFPTYCAQQLRWENNSNSMDMKQNKHSVRGCMVEILTKAWPPHQMHWDNFTLTPSPCGLSRTTVWHLCADISHLCPQVSACGRSVCVHSHAQLIADLQQVEPEACWLVRGRVIRPGDAAVVPTEKHMSGINSYRQNLRSAHLHH